MTFGGIHNNHTYWVNKNNTYAVWNDGQTGNSEDWVFGQSSNIGDDSDGLIFSNDGTATPCDVTDWYDHTILAQPSSMIENTIVSGTIGNYINKIQKLYEFKNYKNIIYFIIKYC